MTPAESIPATEKNLSETLQMPILSLNHIPKEQVVEQVVSSPATAVSRSQGHQTHWPAFEPLLGTSVLDSSFEGVSGFVVVEEVV